VADALTKVVLATGDCRHPALAALGATAFLT
jgi:thiamine biosynthesis lipoprotein